MNHPLYVFDLDGTLAGIDHRLHHIKQFKPRWQDFFEACDQDQPIDWIIELLQMVRRQAGPNGRVVVLTGRSESVRGKTERWFKRHAIECDALIMRPARDFRSDDVLKLELLQGYLREHPGYVVRFIVDDRQKVVDMWRREGFNVLQCAAWAEDQFVDLKPSVP
jgi:hypothetical protein